MPTIHTDALTPVLDSGAAFALYTSVSVSLAGKAGWVAAGRSLVRAAE